MSERAASSGKESLDGAQPGRRQSAQARSDRQIRDISELKTACSIPGTFLRVLEVINDEKSTRKTMARVIEGDPDLMERILSAANSPLYLTYNDRIDASPLPVTNLPTAILKLGFSGVRNIACTQGLSEMARGGHELGVDIVVHLLVVAEVGRALGFRRGRTLGEDAYFGGLMHDFGKLALLRTLPLEYLRIAARCQSRACTALQAEEELLAPSQPLLKNHVQTGAELLRAHGLAEQTVAAIEGHHDDPALHVRAGTAWEMPWLVIIANQLAYHIGYPDGMSEMNPAYLSIQELVDLLDIDHGTLDQIVQEGVSRVNDAIASARIPVKPKLMRRIREIEMSLPPSARVAQASTRATDEPYGACLTLIDLARSRAVVGFYDFKAHTGLDTASLQQYLDKLTEDHYLRIIGSESSRPGYQATSKLHQEQPHDILRSLVMNRSERGPEAA